MASQASTRPTPIRLVTGVAFLVLAAWMTLQLAGLLAIGHFADRAIEQKGEIRVPLFVRGLGLIADRLHDEVLNAPLDPRGSNWPAAFRWFFALQLCGIAGLSLGFAQLGFGMIRSRSDWTNQATSILSWSCLAMIIGFLMLKLVG